MTTDGRVRGSQSLDLEGADAHAISAGEDSLTFSGETHAQDPSDAVEFALSDSTMISLTAAADSLGSVAASASSAGTLVVDVAAGARTGQVAYVDLSFTSTAGGPWSGETRLAFAGPDLEAYVLAVDDSSGLPVSGDGDGVIVIPPSMAEAAIEGAEKRIAFEQDVSEAIESGDRWPFDVDGPLRAAGLLGEGESI